MSMKNLALIVIKVALTIPVAYALAYPFLNPAADGGVFKEVETLGVFGSLVLVATFLAAVFLYCRDLYRCLGLVSPGARKASPRSVWLMFLIPYNFVEDFFIVANVAGSLRQEAVGNAALHRFKSFGMVSGLGWCAAQIVSLLPHSIGSIAGALALPLWIVHWRLIRQINAALSEALNQAGPGVGQRV
ncbi:hypothetical protein [Paucibacter sp. M5-1]|uniref:hypothetical protein n=1 Tax=Paucibacter sp. M5-1 TaxID=3015998 RepID=UPI0022B878E6|nr:hypothetical protein [Paucibacter sp. M5-1]MCZ7884778.1 hypothetical protein [Paucibacter sp. M5-1]